MHTKRLDFKARRQCKKYYTDEQWTKELIEFFSTHSKTLWKDRCKIAHAPGADSPDNSSARSRQAAQLRVETAYAHAPLMLAHDRRVLDLPLEERRTTELVLPRHRQQRNLNPLDIEQQSRTRIYKPQNRSRGQTCRRSGSNLSYIGIDATGLKK
jgi:hypothetical protein